NKITVDTSPPTSLVQIPGSNGFGFNGTKRPTTLSGTSVDNANGSGVAKIEVPLFEDVNAQTDNGVFSTGDFYYSFTQKAFNQTAATSTIANLVAGTWSVPFDSTT